MNKHVKWVMMTIVIFTGFLLLNFIRESAAAQSRKPVFKTPPIVKLQRFELNAGKEDKFREWMDYLRKNRGLAVETLEGEKMYFESVFSEQLDGNTYVYWLTFNGEGGKPVESSNHELDKKHLEFWNDCIKKGSRKVIGNEFYLTPEFIDKAITKHQRTEK